MARLRSAAYYATMARVAEDELTPLGELLESARLRRRMARREAARRARISDSWWRSVVRGTQVGREHLEANPTAQVVAAMARAVDVDPAAALALAGFSVQPGDIDVMIADWDEMHAPETPATPPLPPELDDLIAIYLSADETEREVILGQVRFLIRAIRPTRERA